MIFHSDTGDRDYFALAQPLAHCWRLFHHYDQNRYDELKTTFHFL